MKQTHSLLLLVFLLCSPLALISCGELSTPGDPISITNSQPKEAYLDEYYTNLIRVTGGLNSYTYKIDKGSLPPGLTLSSVGAIEGIPTTEGSYSFTVVVTDANLSKTFADLTMTVQKAPPAQLSLNIPETNMTEAFPVNPEILNARALQGFRTKLTWDASLFTLVEDSVRATSDRVIMFHKAEEGSLQIDIGIKGQAITGNHRLFTFGLEPLGTGPVAMQGQVEFVRQDGKTGFQQLNVGQQTPTDTTNTDNIDNTGIDSTGQAQEGTQNQDGDTGGVNNASGEESR